jgi:hypothetical protein
VAIYHLISRAHHVGGRRIPVGEGVPGWYGPLGTQVGAFKLSERIK